MSSENLRQRCSCTEEPHSYSRVFKIDAFHSLLQFVAQNMYSPSWDLHLKINFSMISLWLHEHLKKANCRYTYLYRDAFRSVYTSASSKYPVVFYSKSASSPNLFKQSCLALQNLDPRKEKNHWSSTQLPLLIRSSYVVTLQNIYTRPFSHAGFITGQKYLSIII